MKFIDLKKQYQCYQQEIDNAVREVIDATQFIGGSVIAELERDLSKYVGVPYAIACSSGTDALLLTLMSLDVGPGDEVITTPYSFIATAEVIALLRAKTIFVDVDPNTYNIDPKQIEKKINSKTKAIIPVSLFGQTPFMEEINEIANKHEVTVIEDAAQSFGAEHGDKRSGNLSPMATTSFFPAKPLGGYGDGGAVFSQDSELFNKIKMLLNHGQSKQYYHDYIGINGRLDAIQAAILKVKLRYLDEELATRNRIAEFYNQGINQAYFTTQKISNRKTSAYAQYCLTINDIDDNGETRDHVVKQLQKLGVPIGIYYPVPIHLQKPFLALGYKSGDFPVSEKLSKTMFSLPVHPFLTKEEQKQVLEAVNSISF